MMLKQMKPMWKKKKTKLWEENLFKFGILYGIWSALSVTKSVSKYRGLVFVGLVLIKRVPFVLLKCEY